MLQLLQILTVFFLPKYFFLDTIWHHEWSVTILFLSFNTSARQQLGFAFSFSNHEGRYFSIVPFRTAPKSPENR